MDYEKKYKALVEAVKTLKETNPSDEGIQNWVNDNVPELIESEEENIRKTIIYHIKNCDDTIDEDTEKRMLAWLEKQGEKKSIKPKFEVGDTMRTLQEADNGVTYGIPVVVYIDEKYYHEREWLGKGYYHGFMDAKKNLWHKATDPKDLPAIDREVIALTTEGKVVFAHRPKESWTGKNIVTGEVTTYHPKRYGTGGWNSPDIKWWLDIEIPLRGE